MEIRGPALLWAAAESVFKRSFLPLFGEETEKRKKNLAP
jgi:hypothetical protein